MPDDSIPFAEACVLIDRFFERARWVYLASHVREELADIPEPLLRAVGTALGYMLREGTDRAQYPGYGPFIPIFQFGERVSAPPFDAVPPEIGEAWEQLGLACTVPAARALFLDLSWCARVGDKPGRLGALAIDAYLELGTKGASVDEDVEDKGCSPYSRAECLRRALSLVRELNQRDRLPEVCAALEAAARAAVEHDSVGTAMLLLRVLVHLPADLRPTSLLGLLDDASTRFSDSVWDFTEVGDLRAVLAGGGDETRVIRNEQLDHLLAEADAHTGLIRVAALQKCLEFAREHGLADRLPELRRALDAITPESLDLKEISVEVNIPREKFDQFIQSFAAPDTVSGALERFAIAGGSAPSGDHQKNLEQVEASRRDAPIHFLATQIIVDEAGRPITTAAGGEAADRLELLRQEVSGISFWGVIGAMAFDAIVAKHGQPNDLQLVQFLTRHLMTQRSAAAVARAFAHYLRGDYEAAIHVALPQVEATVRDLCRQAGIPVSREAVGDNGGVAPLGTLLHALDASNLLDKSWVRYLITALTEPAGLNLRNRIAHGLIEEVTREHALVVLHIACFLSILQPVTDRGSEQAAGS
ncbi:MAG: DUF4209 domain-containing protein [Dehalococcoidia bacterium]